MALPAGTTVVNGFALTPDGALYVTLAGGSFNPSSVVYSGVTGSVPFVLSHSGIPFIDISSGSIGNNGALTAITALPRTFSEGAYIYLPIGAIAAGIPAAAAWYWCVFSSTTAGTIYNSVYTTGTPTTGVLTAFSTTGPGAYTGDTSEKGITITIPAGAMGANGVLRLTSLWGCNNTAGAKAIRWRFGGIGGTAFLSNNQTTQLSIFDQRQIVNAGVTNVQIGGTAAVPFNTATPGVSPTTSAVDTTVATTILPTLQKAVATDNNILSNYMIELIV